MDRPIDPVTLRLFVSVCEERNIARAAAREAIVASAVSKRIGALEREVGAALLLRGRRGIEPTAAGEVLLRQARELLGSMARLRSELSEFASGVHGSVRVMASVSALAEELPDDIAGFLARHQSVRVSLDECVSPDIVRGVREGVADLGVLWDAIDLQGLRSRPYRSDHLVVAVHREHPLARRKSLRFEETLAHAFIGVAPGGTMDTLLRRQAALLGRLPIYRIQVSSLDAACRIVAAGLGVAIVPLEATAAQARAMNLVTLKLRDAWALRRFVICSRPDTMLSATARLLLEHLAATARHA